MVLATSPTSRPSRTHSPQSLFYKYPQRRAQPSPPGCSAEPLSTPNSIYSERRAVRWGGAGAARGIRTSGSIHVYTGMGPDRAEGLGRHLGAATRPQTEDASFRLVLSLHRCRIRSALGRGGTAGCGFAGWVAGCSPRGLPGLCGPGRAGRRRCCRKRTLLRR